MPDPTRFWLGVVLGTAFATIVLTTTVLLAAQLERRDRINTRTACHARGGEVVLVEDGAWRCVRWQTEAR